MGKKGNIVIFFLVLTLLCLCLPGWGVAGQKPANKKLKLSLRLHGGFDTIQGQDINGGERGEFDGQAWDLSWSYTPVGTFKELRSGFDGKADLLLHLNDRWALSLGFGAFWASQQNELVVADYHGLPLTATFDSQVSAFPLTLGAVYALPLKKAFGLYIQAGAGYYFSWVTIDHNVVSILQEFQALEKAHGGGLGFQAGLGLEYRLNDRFFIFTEIGGRYAKIDGYQGDYEKKLGGAVIESGSGTLYCFRGQVWAGGPEFKGLVIQDQEPSGPLIYDAHEAVIDFSGYSARVGVRIRF